MKIRILILVGLVAGMLSVVVSLQGSPAKAVAGPCGTAHDALSAEEQEFLGLLQSWRNANLPVSTALESSGALNAAAAWFAEWQVANGTPGGHNDGYGRNWVQRAVDCGYSGTTSGGQPYALGSGEGTFAVAAAGGAQVGPAEAITGITYAGSGVYAWTPSTGLRFKCAGVGVARNAAGTAVAWVVVVAQYPAGLPCPGSSGTPPTATTTATNTPTVTPTPSPTPSPTPTARPGAPSVYLGAGWNLAVLPPGPVGQVLARADGCYRAVYQWDGSRWLRYLPGTPDYANNLWTLNGGTFWVEGTAANCGLVTL